LTGTGFVPGVRTADAVHGDFQANGALAYAKQQRQNPRTVAQALVEQLGDLAPLFDVSVAGPGFINLRLKPTALLPGSRLMAPALRSPPEPRRLKRIIPWS